MKASQVWLITLAKEEFPFTKFKSQIILMTKKNLHYHITINYDKSSSACIDLSHVVAKNKYNCDQIMCSYDQLRKLVAKEQPVGRRRRIFFLFVTYTIIQSITSSEMCSLHLTHPSAHTWSSMQPTLRHPGSSWGFGALLKGLTSVMDNSCRSRDSNPQPRVTSPTLYPLGHDCPLNKSRALVWHLQLM